MYKLLIRRCLFLFSPENAHTFTFRLLKFLCWIPFAKMIIAAIYLKKDKALERNLFGLTFRSPVGLAAGFDKDAELYEELGCFGFGFVEIGTVTPLPQTGNDKPRLFRLKPDQALVNRMGFNNQGAEAVAKRLKRRKKGLIIGGNIGKNKLTPNEDAASDYLKCFEALFPYVDYFAVNVSSPNTPNLRALQDKEPLTALLQQLMDLNKKKISRKPILLKIAPDLTDAQLDDIIEIVHATKIQGVIATNTTIGRGGLQTTYDELEAIGAGGLSGKPISSRSTQVIKYLHQKSQGGFPIIGVGGIHSAEDALEKIAAGASLVQLYTGFIYEGPALVKNINRKLAKNAANSRMSA